MATSIHDLAKATVYELDPNANQEIQIVVITGSVGYLIDISGGAGITPAEEFVTISPSHTEKTFRLENGESLYIKGNGKVALNLGSIIGQVS